MDFVHFEDVIGGGEDDLFLVGEDHGLEDIDGLGDVGHGDAIGVGVEDMEVEGGDEGIAEGVLLVEEAGIGAGFDVVPGSPFIDDHADTFAGVVLVHDGAVAGDEFIHEEGTAQGVMPFGFCEVGG